MKNKKQKKHKMNSRLGIVQPEPVCVHESHEPQSEAQARALKGLEASLGRWRHSSKSPKGWGTLGLRALGLLGFFVAGGFRISEIEGYADLDLRALGFWSWAFHAQKTAWKTLKQSPVSTS